MDESAAVVVIAVVGLGLVAGALALHHHAGLPGTELTAEVNNTEVVVIEQAMTPEPGTVWTIAQTPSGLMFKETSSQLIERLNLSVNLSMNDVIAPHLYDWYFDGVDDYIIGLSTTMNTTSYSLSISVYDVGGGIPVQYDNQFKFQGSGMTFWAKLNGTWVALADAGRVVTAGEYTATVSKVVRYYANGTLLATVGISNYEVTPPDTLYLKISMTPNYQYKGYIRYVIVHDRDIGDEAIEIHLKHIVYKPTIFLDPTFYNGTYYIDLISNIAGTPYGVARIPAQHTWLWLIKGLASDNKLHLKYVPPGSVFRIKYGGMVYEWRIPSDNVNAAGLVEDYAIDLASVFGSQELENATIELVYPSERVRFYVPPGFQVVLEDRTTGTREVADAPNGVVTLAGGNIVKLVAPRGEGRLCIHVDETPAVYRFTVVTADGRVASGAYVWVYDQDGNIVAYGRADGSGVYELKRTPQTPSIVRVKAAWLDSGTYYHALKDFKLAGQPHTTTQTPAPKPLLSGGMAKVALSLGLAFVFAIIAAVFVGARR